MGLTDSFSVLIRLLKSEKCKKELPHPHEAAPFFAFNFVFYWKSNTFTQESRSSFSSATFLTL